MKDEAGNYHFEANNHQYKIPKLNWREEERFLIVARGAGLDMFSGEDPNLDLFTEGGMKLRENVLGYLFVMDEHTKQYKQLTEQYQDVHFTSVIQVIQVVAEAITGITSFLAPESSKDLTTSPAQQGKESENPNTGPQRKTTLKQ